MLNNHERLQKATESGCGEHEERKDFSHSQHLSVAFSFYGLYLYHFSLSSICSVDTDLSLDMWQTRRAVQSKIPGEALCSKR